MVWAALGPVDLARAVARHLRPEGRGSETALLLGVGERAYDLTVVDRLMVVGVEKAGAGMEAAGTRWFCFLA